jgi:glyoxylase-like metal-dependent hydrolase (beta-lactamase superfamily II)
MSRFRNARFFVQARELYGFLMLRPNEETYFCPAHWLHLLPRIVLINGDYELKPGIELIFTGGHSQGHQVLKVQTEAGNVVLSGDINFDYDNLWKTIPPSYWEAFRKREGGKFYWSKDVLPTIETWLAGRENRDADPPPTRRFLEIKSLGDRLLSSHDRGLAGVKSIP